MKHESDKTSPKNITLKLKTETIRHLRVRTGLRAAEGVPPPPPPVTETCETISAKQ